MHHRRKERADLIRLFERGSSAQLLAPRRIGKTWLMNRVAGDLTKKGWLAIVIDVEGMRSEEEFLKALCSELQEADPLHKQVFAGLGQRLRQVMVGDWSGNPIEAISKVNSKDFAEGLISSLNEQERDTVILVDEISLFLLEYMRRDHDATRDFLYSLRRLMQRNPRVRWLLTGSIGLDVVARRGGFAGALVDLTIFPLEPFTVAEARSYLDTLCMNGEILCPFEIAEDDFSFLANELGWLAPYYLKLVADRTRPAGPAGASGRPVATRDDIEAAFEELLKPNQRTSFSVWEEHIKKNFELSEASILERILSACCESIDGETEETLLSRVSASPNSVSTRELADLLIVLENDGMLLKVSGRWRFCSGLVRRYWLRYWHV